MEKNKKSISDRLFSNKNLIIFFSFAVFLSSAALFMSSRSPAKNGVAVIRKNGEILYTIELDNVAEPYFIDTGGNILLVEKGRISVSSADCPDSLCVKQGAISRHSQVIVCLPNRLSISIENAADKEGVGKEDVPDAFVK
ncbi:MAG: NusG domain II-containing protein [Clostridiales bacterium]|jgi:hypothetical protein|nr:NusG domain II-containing protein [Clostridiales bacterium]